VNLGCATGHPSFVMSNSFSNQTLGAARPVEEQGRLQGRRVHATEETGRGSRALHLDKIGVKLTSSVQSRRSIWSSGGGPYKRIITGTNALLDCCFKAAGNPPRVLAAFVFEPR